MSALYARVTARLASKSEMSGWLIDPPGSLPYTTANPVALGTQSNMQIETKWNASNYSNYVFAAIMQRFEILLAILQQMCYSIA